MDREAEIFEILEKIENRFAVRILYACESGSRAWRFASRDSDYDVRFIYLRSPSWYLSVDLEQKRDVIELPIEGLMDVNGWDLRKALRLFRKSNPPLLEWLQSPIVYRDEYGVAHCMRELFPHYYSPEASMHHYLHMAKRNYRGYLCDDVVKTKKYLYVLRPLLACQWIEDGYQAAPMEFNRLLSAADLPDKVIDEIHRLLDRKTSGEELGEEPRNGVLSRFIESEFARHSRNGLLKGKPNKSACALDNVFRDALTDVYQMRI